MAQFTTAEMNQLRTQMYSGFITKSVPRYEWRGAGSGRARRQTGYDQVTNYDAYNYGLLSRARDAAGISKVNNADEIRRIYDFIGGYQPPAQAAAPAAPVVPQISAESKQYRAETEKLLAEATKQREDFAAEQVAAKKAAEIAEQTRLRTLRTSAANQERGNQGANLQIKPAPSTPQIGGTQPFKRRRNQFAINKPSYSGLSISQAGMVNV